MVGAWILSLKQPGIASSMSFIAMTAPGCSLKMENFIVAELVYDTPSKPQVLLFDSQPTAQTLQQVIASGGYTVINAGSRWTISPHLRPQLATSDVVLLDVTQRSSDVLKQIEEINTAISICGGNARLLCISAEHRNPRFALEIQKRGARYVNLSDPGAVFEAIDSLLAEANEVQQFSFRIVHRYSQGSCAPGEEISAIFLARQQQLFQLPLGLAQRLLFDFLAQHRQISLDSLQILSGLSGDWFYRDHAANSGYRQMRKIRRQAIKVLIQRIREAMDKTFREAHLTCNASDVLRSPTAAGTKRALYRLHADVRWQHLR